ncbi:MAG: nucleotidyltransferase family protein [Actinomycetota bacterium]
MRQAVILAGGQATRLRPYTEKRPKAMVEVAGAPIIEHQLRWLAESGVRQVVASVGYRAEVIVDHLGDGSRFGLDIVYAVESEPLGRGGALKFAARMLPHPRERWFGLNGDILARFSLAELTATHHRLGTMATIALAPYRSSWGVAHLEGELIAGFVQSPQLPYWINAGIYAMDAEVVELLPDRGDQEDSTFPDLAASGKLGAFKIKGYWRGIDTAKDVEEASAELSELPGR